MQFKKYPSITNSYNKKFIEKIKEHGFDKEMYYVTEKVHGANFAIYYDGDKFRIASRPRFLADDENFFCCQKLLPELKEKIIALYHRDALLPEINEIVIYGELCGGRYPHKEVKPSNHAKKVQGHVWYHPDNIFYVFDIKIDGKYLSMLSYELFNFEYLCMKQDFFYAKPLFIGTLEECLAFDNKYQTTIPAQFDLPEIENNICEGNVIKPVTPLFFPNYKDELGNEFDGSRVILKNKNERFVEITKRKCRIDKKKELSEEANRLLGILLTHITENRLNNVISKLGEVTINDFGDVMQAYAVDVMDEFTMYNGDYTLLDKLEQKQLRKALNGKASELVRNYFIKS